MSRMINDKPWGPSHQDLAPPFQKKPSTIWKLFGWAVFLFIAWALTHPMSWGIKALLATVLLTLLVRAIADGRLPNPLQRKPPAPQIPQPMVQSRTPGQVARQHITRLGGGAFLGVSQGRWVTADPEHAVMILGPPRSGKTSSVIIPAILAAPGAALVTSTKPDVMQATMSSRSEIGQVWLFDPTGEQHDLPDNVRRLSWSPVAAAATWDQALLMARAMTACTKVSTGTTNETHWTERATALLAPLLYAANLTNQPISQVLRWVLRQNLTPALQILNDNDTQIPADVLIGIQNTEHRERSSIFSATAGVLAAYNSDAVRTAANTPNFDPHRFAQSTDTIYITAPAHQQALSAPLVVGLLEQIRHATYQQATHTPVPPTPMLWALDEVANIAPIHDLPALASEAGGQHLHLLICLQDLSQARTRWGDPAADGFLSLFQTKLILTGIADSKTLESISLALGEYDRQLVSKSLGRSDPQEWFTPPTHNETINYQTQRQRTLNPGEIAKLPIGHGLLLKGANWELLQLTPWHKTQPWKTLAGVDPGPLARPVIQGRVQERSERRYQICPKTGMQTSVADVGN
jgi:type IV secretion system protein VirD4